MSELENVKMQNKLHYDKYYDMVKTDPNEAYIFFTDILRPLAIKLEELEVLAFGEEMLTTKSNASNLNQHLFKLGWSFEDSYKPSAFNYGKVELGKFINELLATYTITRKTDAKN